MSDGVKFIFKTLLKVPVIIVVSFFILNIFAFFFIYFKVLGLSYVVMQTAVENNYLPKTEANTLCNYAYTFEKIPMVTNSAIIVGKSGSTYSYIQSASDSTVIAEKAKNAEGSGRKYVKYDITSGQSGTALKKVQYGNSVTVGVHCGYRMIWPLTYKETIKGVTSKNADKAGTEGVIGYNSGESFAGFKSTSQLNSDREDKETLIAFDIIHKVPGLKYYPDLLTK